MYITSDLIVFISFHILFYGIFLYALFRELISHLNSGGITVKRGEESYKNLHLAYSIIAIIFLELINTTDAFRGHKTIITLIDLSILLYLCLYNSWFRNKLIHFHVLSKEKIEKLKVPNKSMHRSRPQ